MSQSKQAGSLFTLSPSFFLLQVSLVLMSPSSQPSWLGEEGDRTEAHSEVRLQSPRAFTPPLGGDGSTVQSVHSSFSLLICDAGAGLALS